MSENVTMSRWDRFNNFLNKTLVPLSWLTLGLGILAIVLSVVNSDYDLLFWVAVALALWSVYDLVTYYWRKNRPVAEPPLGECDHSQD